MPRPRKFRRVEFIPAVTVFKPAGVPRRDLEEVVLTIEELEAIRLKDLEGLEQEECAQRMQVSRPTFQRILVTAHEKVAKMLTRGLALRVEGGTYQLVNRRRCRHCQTEFELPPDQSGDSGKDVLCPRCQGEENEIPPTVGTRAQGGRGHGVRRRGRGRLPGEKESGPDETLEE